jgi:hypothetical protein
MSTGDVNMSKKTCQETLENLKIYLKQTKEQVAVWRDKIGKGKTDEENNKICESWIFFYKAMTGFETRIKIWENRVEQE